MKKYTTLQGDMWDGIAYKMYGTCNVTDLLMSANIEYHEVYIFTSGIVLDVPEISSEQSANSTLPPWKLVR